MLTLSLIKVIRFSTVPKLNSYFYKTRYLHLCGHLSSVNLAIKSTRSLKEKLVSSNSLVQPVLFGNRSLPGLP